MAPLVSYMCPICVIFQEEWAEEVRTNLAPLIIRAHLSGDAKTLKPWLGEAVYHKLLADIRVVSDHDTLHINTFAESSPVCLARFNISATDIYGWDFSAQGTRSCYRLEYSERRREWLVDKVH